MEQRTRFNIQPPTESKTVISLIVLIVLERLIISMPLFATHWGTVLHYIVVSLSILVSLKLLKGYGAQLVDQARQVMPGIGHLIKSRLGIKSRQAPERYIRALFNEYASSFDDHLVGHLNYQIPSQIYTVVTETIEEGQRFSVLDLGCGTGLCAPIFEPIAQEIIGIDLSEEMLKIAKTNGRYQRLICDSLTNIDTYFEDHFDLVIAADVLVYFGELDQVLASVAKVLIPGGRFAFSVEFCKDQPWAVNQSGRYAHSREYIRVLADRLGFKCIRVERHTIRSEKGVPVIGDIYFLQHV